MSEFQIKTETAPNRCEICHQVDCFDAINSDCARCINLAPKNFETAQSQLDLSSEQAKQISGKTSKLQIKLNKCLFIVASITIILSLLFGALKFKDVYILPMIMLLVDAPLIITLMLLSDIIVSCNQYIKRKTSSDLVDILTQTVALAFMGYLIYVIQVNLIR